MNVRIRKSQIEGSVCAPPSKSVAHRIMIATALSGGVFLCENGGKDMRATAECLAVMSPFIGRFLRSENEKNVSDCTDSAIENGDSILPHLNAGESGSTLRFLLPVICALGMNCVFEGEGRLKDRPLDGLIKALNAHGCEFEKLGSAQLPLKVSGKLCAGVYEIDGSVSSQYITGLLFALPLLAGDSRIVLNGDLVSANYVDITLGVLADFGVKIEKTTDGYFVKGSQKFTAPNDPRVEGDWSSAGFLIALGTLCGEVGISELREDSLQGDRIVVDLLRRAGTDIKWDGDVLVARKSALKAIDFDAQNCPDAVPIMATLLSFAEGISHISHVDRLRDKESDRLSAIREMLADFGIKTEYRDDVLCVYGGEHTPCVTQGFNDHRMAMSAMVCALCTEGESEVRGVECIAKSYPAFIEHAFALGARIEEAISK